VPATSRHGTGILARTQFAVAPVVVFTSVAGQGGGYVVYGRLTRDLPRGRDGGIDAAFNLTSNPDAVQGNPVSRRPHGRYCFEQPISYLSTQPTPTQDGARVTLTLTAHDRHHRRGMLSATVRLSARTVQGNVSEGSYPRRAGC
jgi:hypothetical protein